MKRLQAMMFSGMPGLDVFTVAGLAVLAFAAVFYFSALRPGEARLQHLWERAARVRQQAARHSAADAPKTPADKIAAFYRAFPPPSVLPDLLDKIFEAARAQGVKLDQGEYRVAKDASGMLTQYEIIFPVKGTYPQMRRFAAAALTAVPTLSLESIKFERKKVGDAVLDAKVRFIVYLGRPS